VTRISRYLLPLILLIYAVSFASALPAQTATPAANSIVPGPRPPDVSLNWKELAGIYGQGPKRGIVLERDGKLIWHRDKDAQELQIEDYDHSKFVVFGKDGLLTETTVHRNANGVISSLTMIPRDSPFIGQPIVFLRIDAGADPSHFFRVTPAEPVAELRAKALKLAPPEEAGPFRKPDLVELATLDPAIHLDIRYATTKNFLSTPVYTEARAFMQRPAAEALVRVLRKLQPLGYGLLIHDAYRPWYVTKIFWDATPPEGKIFVANPQEGSKHNRGCAVDLTLYDLATGQAIEMPGLYDEMSPRSFPNFRGGTSLQRWHRDLLRRAMESEGFTVNEDEWWHFDYKDWKQYGILNVPFEKLGISQKPAAVTH
jgi:D-alanyl-D-alanine dipeptidase